MPIKAITFDLWDTLFIDDSDEPKRKERGLLPKPLDRLRLAAAFASKVKPVSTEAVHAAYQAMEASFTKVWKEHYITWRVAERVNILTKALGIHASEEACRTLVQSLEEMELDPSPDLIAGVGPALRELKKHYRLGIISDTIYSPGRVLRRLLEKEDLLGLFDAFVFSDEAGHSKPHPDVFALACKGLGAAPHEVCHIGDREPNDILGAQASGLKAVLCLAAVTRENVKKQEDGRFSHYQDLPKLIQSLDGDRR